MSLFYGNTGYNNPSPSILDASIQTPSATPAAKPNLVFGQNAGSPNVTDSPNRPAWQNDVFQTSPVMAALERAGYTFVRNNPGGIAGGAGDLGSYDVGAINDIVAWVNSIDWSDPEVVASLDLPGSVVPIESEPAATEPTPAPVVDAIPATVTQPTQPVQATQPVPATQDDGGFFSDILGNIDFSGSYDFGNIFGDSTLDPTAPFVPQPTTGTTPPSSDSSGANDGSTGGTTGVDLGNESVPASDVVEGGQSSTLDDNNINLDLIRLLGGLSLGQQQAQAQQQQQANNTRTTDTIFRDRLEFKTPNPGLLTPIFRS